MARLEFKYNPQQYVDIGQNQVIIGSHTDCDLVVPDAYVSERQCRIVSQAGRYLIQNLGDSPILVNGHQVEQKALMDGDEVTISDHKLIFRATKPQTSSYVAKDEREAAFTHTGLGAQAKLDAVTRLISSHDPSVYYEIHSDGEMFIGRDPYCDVPIPDEYLADRQSRIYVENGVRFIQNLGETPLVINGQQVDKHALRNLDEITISGYRYVYHVESEQPAPPVSQDKSILSATENILHDMIGPDLEEIRKRSQLIVKAFEKAQKKQKKKYTLIIAAAGMIAVIAGAYALYNHIRIGRQRSLGESIFYAMKTMDLEMSRLQRKVDVSPEQMRSYREKRRQMEKDYEQFTSELDVYSRDLSQQERLILKMARIFGECEINMPKGFVQEVQKYISEWRRGRRYNQAMKRAFQKGYHTKIGRVMLDHDLPPQFFYLALVESDFKHDACGPETRFGIAKGMWQFIPITARKYGLSVGPLQEYRKPDPRDDRHDIDKSTGAAAQYIRFIYDTEAQASGLLVMASYNWGEHRVTKFIRKMPENPRERNFWRLLTDYGSKVPNETYNYVYRIFSAAVIGEDPRLFGFDFDNPFLELKDQLSRGSDPMPDSFVSTGPVYLDALHISSTTYTSRSLSSGNGPNKMDLGYPFTPKKYPF